MTPLRNLDDLPVRIEPAEIDAAMQPFLVGDSFDQRWRALYARRRRKTLKRALGRLWGRREKAAIREEYTEAWSVGYERYRLDRADLKPAPWEWRGRHMLLDAAAATRVRTVLFGAVLTELKPRTVLEVGCGNGINLFSLAGAFPDISFTGVDLTEEGIAQARRAQGDEATLEILRRYSPLEVREPDALTRITFVQGDASALPFGDSSFDLVLTVLAVEQMERIRSAALSEIGRVASGHALMLEPFRDVNAGGLKRLYTFARDYFRGSIAELADHGLTPVWATEDYPQEAFLGSALVLSRKA